MNIDLIHLNNMSLNNYKTNIQENALHGMANGILIATKVVAPTMGAKGTNVVIEREQYPYSEICNDGATIIDSLQFEDACERRGLQFLKEAVARSNSNAGDGSTGTCVLVNGIIQEGVKSGAKGLEIKESLDSLLPIIIEKIDAQKREITVNEVEAVATIAGESEKIGKTLAEIYKKIGKDGIIHPEGSGTYNTSYDFVEGVRFTNTGFLSPYMVYDEQAKKEGRKEVKAVYENPTILITKRKIDKISDIDPLIRTLQAQNKKNLVIFTDDMDSNVASTLVKAHKEGIFNILIIKAPVLWKNYVFEDFARCTGATIIEDSSGISSFKNLPLAVLGTCEKLTTDENETVLIGIKDISEHIENLKTKEDTDSKVRLTYLTQKTALLKIGSQSETELTYLRLKWEDAIHSSRLALQDGIVAGGGVCLLNISKEMPDTIGGKIMRKALEMPFRQIGMNADFDIYTEDKAEHIGLNSNWGFDAKTKSFKDMFDAGIVDSAIIVKQAVRNAIGIASTVLTTNHLISLPLKSAEQIASEVLMQKGVRPF